MALAPRSTTPPDDTVYGLRLPRPMRDFLETESASGILLLAATVVALVWVNSPWASSYASMWTTPIELQFGTFAFSTELGHLVNEGLMALFFFMVGLEIKYEFVAGDLRRWKTASLPVICAIGGVALPAVIFVILNAGHPGANGWGIPMATDIAFAVGVVTVLGSRVPPSLKLFLLTLAVVDDLIAIIVIGIFYSSGISLGPLAVAAALLIVIVFLRLARVHWWPAFVVPGVAVWFAIHASGASATVAGVLLALLVPARPRAPGEILRDWELDLTEDLTPEDVRLLNRYAKTAVSTAERVIHDLHPSVNFVILPLFALANAGVVLSLDVFDAPGATRVALGIGAGLVLGKLLGISVFGALAIRMGVADLPRGATWPQFFGLAAVAGIGFTVSLFIANMAFTDPALVQAAKLAILVASIAAAGLGAGLVIVTSRRPTPRPGDARPHAAPPAAG